MIPVPLSNHIIVRPIEIKDKIERVNPYYMNKSQVVEVFDIGNEIEGIEIGNILFINAQENYILINKNEIYYTISVGSIICKLKEKE